MGLAWKRYGLGQFRCYNRRPAKFDGDKLGLNDMFSWTPGF